MLVFVYGTLMEGGHNNYILHKAKLLGRGFTLDTRFEMMSFGAFPGVVDFRMSDDADEYSLCSIAGEVWDISGEHEEQTLARLDRLEGNGAFYTRRPVEVVLPDADRSAVVLAWMYLLPRRYLSEHAAHVNDIVTFSHPDLNDRASRPNPVIRAWVPREQRNGRGLAFYVWKLKNAMRNQSL